MHLWTQIVGKTRLALAPRQSVLAGSVSVCGLCLWGRVSTVSAASHTRRSLVVEAVSGGLASDDMRGRGGDPEIVGQTGNLRLP